MLLGKNFGLGTSWQLSNWVNNWRNPGFSTEYTNIMSFAIPLVTVSVSYFQHLLFLVYFCTLDRASIILGWSTCFTFPWIDNSALKFNSLYFFGWWFFKWENKSVVFLPFTAMECWHNSQIGLFSSISCPLESALKPNSVHTTDLLLDFFTNSTLCAGSCSLIITALALPH